MDPGCTRIPRRVLWHELAHNIWGDHDNNFKELNSLLNKEVAHFERSRAEGAQSLGGADEHYDPSPASLEADAQSQMLGGGASVIRRTSSAGSGDSPAERRRYERRRRTV